MGIRRPGTAATAVLALAASLPACAGHGGGPTTAGGRPTGASATSAAPRHAPAASSTAARLEAAARATTGTPFHTRIITGAPTSSGNAPELRAEGDYGAGGPPSARLRSLGGGAAPREYRLVGDVLYVRRGNVMRPGGGGRPWMRVTSSTDSQPLRWTRAAVARGFPGVSLRAIATSRDAHPVATSAKGGPRYAGTFAVPATAGGRWAYRDLAMFRTLHFDIRLSTAGRPASLVLTGAADHRRYTLVQTFTGWGTPVHIVRPPSRQVDDGRGPAIPRSER